MILIHIEERSSRSECSQGRRYCVEDVVPLSARFEDEEDDDDGDFPPAFIKNRRV